MTDNRKRFKRGIAAAVGIHFLAAIFIGVLGIKYIEEVPEEILEVSIGGGDGGASEVIETTAETSFFQSIEDLIDNKVRVKEQEKPKPKTEQKQTLSQPGSSSVPPSDASGDDNGEGKAEGDGAGSGSGSGEDGGNGRGSGNGSGDGEGSGADAPVKPPRVTKMVSPNYPRDARRQGIEGRTRVKMLVNAEGRVESALVVGSSGNASLDQSALEAVYKWRFSPAKNKQGKDVQCYITLPVDFVLK